VSDDYNPMWHEWNEGGVAAGHYKPRTNCPYPMDSPQGRRWLEGWESHQREDDDE
jgi:ribosome modulation factor